MQTLELQWAVPTQGTVSEEESLPLRASFRITVYNVQGTGKNTEVILCRGMMTKAILVLWTVREAEVLLGHGWTSVENLFGLFCSCCFLAFAQSPSPCERNCSAVREITRNDKRRLAVKSRTLRAPGCTSS